MTRYEQVKRAIHFQKPDYVPLFLFNGDRSNSDIIQTDLVRFYLGEDKQGTEWGFRWESDDPSIPMGNPKNPPLEDFGKFDEYNAKFKPDAFDKSRFADIIEARREFGDNRYYMGSLYLTGFTIMSFLRGFCNLMEDMLIEPENVEKLADLVFGFENDVIRQMADYGFHAVSLWDDWGTQTDLMVAPDYWRRVFKPRYKEQFRIAHEHGLDVFFHSCGKVDEIVPDLIEVGVDMLNLGQPALNAPDCKSGIEHMGKLYAGKVCFCTPADYQTTSIQGTPAENREEVRRIIESMDTPDGGLIAYILDYTENMGMPKDNYRAIIDAFVEYGKKS